ncbi:MAG: 2Fe-2S iron-sulfur cluster binding domain-containing protein [Gammaproteobacteria bacterium]|nr:2Fe-2S iron-sulfur cluster binding domain-containing protein [Gammaproteobacteria bacterium]
MSQEITLNFRTSDGEVRTVDAVVGDSVMETAIKNDIDEIVAECGGSLICATCHCYLEEATFELFDEPDEAESDMLEGTASERRNNSRLSCQLIVSEELDGHTIDLPDAQ